MERKQKFIPPVVEIVELETNDILITSPNGGIELPDDDWRWG